MQQLVISYPDEVLDALHQNSQEFEKEARILLAIKLYETEKLTTGLAAKVAGVSREEFFYLLGEFGLSPFGMEAEELEEDVANARRARHS